MRSRPNAERTSCLVALAVTAALAVGAPPATASTLPVGFPLAGDVLTTGGPCATVAHEPGHTAGNANQVCQGAGLSFIGPAIGQIASIVGPTIIGPAVVGTLVISAGSVAVGP